jgi:tripartite-type tricarboxylate transporter receptor subunit TctC
VCSLLLDAAMGTTVTHVPYRGAGPAMQDLIAGRLDYIAEQIPTALTQIRGGNVKAIATLGLTRAPGLEDLPTAEEQGLKGLDCNSWGAFVFPKGTPDPIVQRLAAATSKALDSPAVRERYEQLGISVAARERRSPDYLAKYIPEEFKRWSGPIKGAGLSID